MSAIIISVRTTVRKFLVPDKELKGKIVLEYSMQYQDSILLSETFFTFGISDITHEINSCLLHSVIL